MEDFSVHLKYQKKEPTLVRLNRGGNKTKVKKGSIKKFSSEMADFYKKEYPKLFKQVDKPKRGIYKIPKIDKITQDLKAR